ncbi:hypothetical protein N657DRAFT_634760 [Parathielavia appendiculata]|uniref:Uncharacterized protein n=1 Tax=Parathielavia appendiculata TaxID=2587402 RepID=A0AAN6TYR2_9PEZI|nr:hypothetical protein N657DRAFT_634760 [Parathielavia appendiculata]
MPGEDVITLHEAQPLRQPGTPVDNRPAPSRPNHVGQRPYQSIAVSEEARSFWDQPEKPEMTLALTRQSPYRRPRESNIIGHPSEQTCSPEKRIDLVYDPSNGDKNMTVQLVMDVEEDWEADFEAFCRLRRLGQNKDARKHFVATRTPEHRAHPMAAVRRDASCVRRLQGHGSLDPSFRARETINRRASLARGRQNTRSYKLFNLLLSRSRDVTPEGIHVALKM